MPQNQASSSSIKEAKDIVRNRSQVLQDKQLDWDRYFLEMLDLVKKRSPDKETKVACILTENNRVISCGFNGWPSHIDNLPNTRPDKYPFMVHSEINAIANLLVKPTNPTAYLTHYPCNVCLKALWQISCRRIIVPKNRKFFSFSEDDQTILDLFKRNGLELVEIGDDSFEITLNNFDREVLEKLLNKMREGIYNEASKESLKDYHFVRVGQGISKVSEEHFGDFE